MGVACVWDRLQSGPFTRRILFEAVCRIWGLSRATPYRTCIRTAYIYLTSVRHGFVSDVAVPIGSISDMHSSLMHTRIWRLPGRRFTGALRTLTEALTRHVRSILVTLFYCRTCGDPSMHPSVHASIHPFTEQLYHHHHHHYHRHNKNT